MMPMPAHANIPCTTLASRTPRFSLAKEGNAANNTWPMDQNRAKPMMDRKMVSLDFTVLRLVLR